MKTIKRKTVADFPELVKQWHPTKNGDLKPNDLTAGSNKKTWWMCEKGHEWKTSISHRKNGTNCPYCSNRKVCFDNCLATTNPELATQWNQFKNGNLTPKDVTAGITKKVWWRCEKGHEWESTIANRKHHGCPYCSGRRSDSDNSLSKLNPELAAQWHPTKNGNLIPESYASKSGVKVWWLCNKGHEWQSTIDNRSCGGTNCPFCSGRKADRDNCLFKLNPELAAQWHPTKNGNITPKDVKIKSNKKVWWLCDKGHEWEAVIYSRTEGTNCPYCSNRKVCFDNCLATTHPQLATQWHETKNGDLTPRDITAGTKKKVWWMCEKGHEWRATPSHRKNGCGCPFCNESKGEKKIAESLGRIGIPFKREAKFRTCRNRIMLRFDFLVKVNERKGFLIEYQGIQHYRPVRFKTSWTQQNALKALKKCQERDKIKSEWARKNKIPLLVIPYRDYSKIPVLIKEFIKTV